MKPSQNGKEKTASYMGNKIKPYDNSGFVNGSQSLHCCHKYNLNYSSLVNIQSEKDEKIYNVLKNLILIPDNSTNTTDHNNSSRLPMTSLEQERDCCHSNITTGRIDDSQVRKCCLRSRTPFTDEISVQTAKDKQVYDVLHKVQFELG